MQRRSLSLLIFVIVTLAAPPAHAQTPPRVRILEAYPTRIQKLLDQRETEVAHALSATGGKSSVSAKFVIDGARLWDSGTTLRVAFNGGSDSVRTAIEDAAVEWANYCNIKFDFRSGGKFHEWSPADKKYRAQIRIAFMADKDNGGYWSALANDSINRKYYEPGQASMNYQGFDKQLPDYYRATVKHEFGHALGFWHEHQHPVEKCDEQLRWNDDPGYVPTQDQYQWFVPDAQGRNPGVYTVFGGPPNNWPKDKIDFAMKHISDADTHAYDIGPFDPESIMKYYYDSYLFLQGDKSPCYHTDNTEISLHDREGAASVYPKDPNAIKRVRAEEQKALRMLPSDLQEDYKALHEPFAESKK